MAVRRTTAWDAVRALFGAIGSLAGVLSSLVETAATVGLLAAIVYVAVLGWHVADPGNVTAAHWLAAFYRLIHRV